MSCSIALAWTARIWFRDCRLDLEKQLLGVWARATNSAALLDMLEGEGVAMQQQLSLMLEEQTRREAAAAHAEQNVPAVFSLKCGQIEVLEGQLFPQFDDAVMLKTAIVQAHNHAIARDATSLLELWAASNSVRQKIHLTRWSIELDELAAAHKLEHIKELQIFHVDRATCQLLESGTTRKGTAADKQMELLLQHSKCMHVRVWASVSPC